MPPIGKMVVASLVAGCAAGPLFLWPLWIESAGQSFGGFQVAACLAVGIAAIVGWGSAWVASRATDESGGVAWLGVALTAVAAAATGTVAARLLGVTLLSTGWALLGTMALVYALAAVVYMRAS